MNVTEPELKDYLLSHSYSVQEFTLTENSQVLSILKKTFFDIIPFI
jgi:hypothetical protein